MAQKLFCLCLQLAIFVNILLTLTSANPSLASLNSTATEGELFPIEDYASEDENELALNASSTSLDRHPRDTGLFRCTRNSQCISIAGPNSQCYRNLCICKLGNISVNSRCLPVKCFSNYDCTRHFAYTFCNSFSRRCVCVSGTHVDAYSQTCRFNSGSKISVSAGLIIASLVAIFSMMQLL